MQHFIDKPSKWLEENPEWVPVFQNVLSKGYLNDVRQIVQILIDYDGFSANATPLHYACLRGQTRVVELIIQVLEDKNPRSTFGSTPLHYAVENCQLEIISVLLPHLEDKNPGNNDEHTPVHDACINGSLDIVQAIVPYIGNVQL